jgi:hypothetical protein
MLSEKQVGTPKKKVRKAQNQSIKQNKKEVMELNILKEVMGVPTISTTLLKMNQLPTS